MSDSQLPSSLDRSCKLPFEVELPGEGRWQIYQRLQELNIPCEYIMYSPLKVKIQHTTQAIQLWSVLQNQMTPRQVLANRLEKCWSLCAIRER